MVMPSIFTNSLVTSFTNSTFVCGVNKNVLGVASPVVEEKLPETSPIVKVVVTVVKSLSAEVCLTSTSSKASTITVSVEYSGSPFNEYSPPTILIGVAAMIPSIIKL